MVLASRPLWWTAADSPRVPWFTTSWLDFDPSGTWGLGLLALQLLSIAGFAWTGGGRIASTLALAIGLIQLLPDQNRNQPWMTQFLVSCLWFVTLPRPQALAMARLYLVALYVHSGLSKLDVGFVREIAPNLLSVTPLGDPTIAPWWREAAAWAMPSAEALCGLALVAGPTRRLGLIGVVLMHLTLLAILGPVGLNQSANVLIWNFALAIQAVVLFGWVDGSGRFQTDTPSTPLAATPRATEAEGVLAPVGRLAALVVLVAPLTERSGWWDAWPSFALYAGHTERVVVELDRQTLDDLDACWRVGLVEPEAAEAPASPWVRFDLNAWSLARRGAPIYPQARSALGLAEAILRRIHTQRHQHARDDPNSPASPPPLRFRVRVYGRSGRGTLTHPLWFECQTFGDFPVAARRFWLNARGR